MSPLAQTDALAAEIARLEREERASALDHFTEVDCWQLGRWLWETAVERGLTIVVDIRRGEHQVFHAARTGTSADNDAWIERKARLVRRFGAASYLVSRRLRAKGQTLDHYGLDPTRYALMGGCVPILVTGVGAVGTLTVSGLPEARDHELALEALRALRRTSRDAG